MLEKGLAEAHGHNTDRTTRRDQKCHNNDDNNDRSPIDARASDTAHLEGPALALTSARSPAHVPKLARMYLYA